MYNSSSYWEQRAGVEEKNPIDWLCSYDTIKPLLLPSVGKPRASALVVGSGTSSFPEQLYDWGIKDVVCLDFSQKAMEVVRARNAQGGRRGLQVVVADVAAEGGPPLKQGPFDLVVDKGSLDCLLGSSGGWLAAERSLSWLYSRLKTPGTLVLVSHSPPPERMELLSTVYWHDVQVHMVRSTPLEELSEAPYREVLEPYPYAIPGRPIQVPEQTEDGEGHAPEGGDRGAADGAAGEGSEGSSGRAGELDTSFSFSVQGGGGGSVKRREGDQGVQRQGSSQGRQQQQQQGAVAGGRQDSMKGSEQGGAGGVAGGGGGGSTAPEPPPELPPPPPDDPGFAIGVAYVYVLTK